MNLKNEYGMTLVEMLAAIALTGIIGVIGYSLLATGFTTYDRVQVESELRDEADLIMASMITELYTLKLSEVEEVHLPEDGTTNYYFQLKDGSTTGFIDNTAIVDDEVVNISNNIEIANSTTVEQVYNGHFRIKLVLERSDSRRKIETLTEISVIDDTDLESEDP